MKIYTIIVTYNGMNWIDKCIKSLIDSKTKTSIVVVDNNSTDETPIFIGTEFPYVCLLRQEKNLGFGQANNIGIAYALKNGATHIFLLNQDAWIEHNTITNLINNDDGEHLLTPIHLNAVEKKIDNNFRTATIIKSMQTNSIVEDIFCLNNQLKQTYPIEYVNAACWLIPRSVIMSIGGFNPLFFHYGEDNNYINRLHYHNIGISLVTNTFIYHDRKQHGNERVYKSNSLYRSLLLICTNINYDKTTKSKLFCKVIIQSIGQAIFQHYFFKFQAEIWKSIFQLLRQRKKIIRSNHAERLQQPNWL